MFCLSSNADAIRYAESSTRYMMQVNDCTPYNCPVSDVNATWYSQHTDDDDDDDDDDDLTLNPVTSRADMTAAVT